MADDKRGESRVDVHVDSEIPPSPVDEPEPTPAPGDNPSVSRDGSDLPNNCASVGKSSDGERSGEGRGVISGLMEDPADDTVEGTLPGNGDEESKKNVSTQVRFQLVRWFHLWLNNRDDENF